MVGQLVNNVLEIIWKYRGVKYVQFTLEATEEIHRN